MARKTTTKGVRKPKKDKKNEPMPGLIYQNGETAPNQPTVEEKLERFRQSQAKSTNWMWLGVIGLAAIIFFFWGWSLISNISLFNWRRTEESALVKKTQSDWNKIFAETAKKETEKRELKEKMSVIIEELKKQAETASTTIVTTASSTTSTTQANTTTTSTIR